MRVIFPIWINIGTNSYNESCDAVVVYSYKETTGQMADDNKHYYTALLLENNKIYESEWMEENRLSLICSNTVKGMPIIKAYYENGARTFRDLT